MHYLGTYLAMQPLFRSSTKTKKDIRAKFIDLAWKEKLRILEGRSDPSSQWVQDMSPHVLRRNRYGNVQPWDKSRVHLKVAEGKSDYINASPISLQDPRTRVETKFIATQVSLSCRLFFADHSTDSLPRVPNNPG